MEQFSLIIQFSNIVRRFKYNLSYTKQSQSQCDCQQAKLYSIIMEDIQVQKQVRSPSLRKQKIFHVRRIPFKHLENEKLLKNKSTIFLHKQAGCIKAQSNKNYHDDIKSSKNAEYHCQLAIITSPIYKQLHNRFKDAKQIQRSERESFIKAFKRKQVQLNRYLEEGQRLQQQRARLVEKREQLKIYINALRERRMSYEQQRREYQRLANTDQLKQALLGMYYQGGVEIDPDNMTYQQLLQLQEKIGKVSKGISEEQYHSLNKTTVTQSQEQQVCSICYQNLKQQQQINQLPCKHVFHCDCIKEWLLKQKICPLCKQEISNQPSATNENA